MPLKKLLLRPGVNTQMTQTQNIGGWSFSNLIRWKDGFLEKIGGWLRLSATACSNYVRGLHAYQDLDGNRNLLIGTDSGAQYFRSGAPVTLTATGRTSTPVAAFITGLGTTSLQVTDPAHGLTAGDTFQFGIPISVTIGATPAFVLWPGTSYTVATVIDANNFTFVYGSVVAAGGPAGVCPQFTTVSGNLAIQVTLPGHGQIAGQFFTIQLPVSVDGQSLQGAYEVLTSGVTFSILAPIPSTSSTSAYELESGGTPLAYMQYTDSLSGADNWTLDNFGNYGLYCPKDGPLYVWNPSAPTTITTVTTAPLLNTGMLVAMPQAQVVCYGAEAAGAQDPLLLRWSAAGSYQDFTAASTNQAGSLRLSRGSYIVGAVQSPQTILIWTDTDMWSMQYIGPPLVYGFSILGSGCGLIAQKARAILGGTTYWMSQKQFFSFDGGGVRPIPCAVWDEIFPNLYSGSEDKTCAAANSQFNEVAFYYASASGTGEIDSYVKLNATSGLWDYGSLTRTAWIDQSVFGNPIGADGNKRLQQHETGYDADGDAMEGVFATTGYIDLGDGTDIIFIDQIIPDLKWFGEDGSVNVTLYAVQYPGGPVETLGPYSITDTTQYISLRMRARQIAFRIDWAETEGFSARLGATRFNAAAAGKRP